MDVSKPVSKIIFLVLFISSFVNSGEEPKITIKDFHLNLTVEVKTTFAKAFEPKGYPWNDGEVIVGCGWVKITYLGYEIKHSQESEPIIVNIPIGQSCDFSEYIASPTEPKIFSLVEWGKEYFLVVKD